MDDSSKTAVFDLAAAAKHGIKQGLPRYVHPRAPEGCKIVHDSRSLGTAYADAWGTYVRADHVDKAAMKAADDIIVGDMVSYGLPDPRKAGRPVRHPERAALIVACRRNLLGYEP